MIDFKEVNTESKTHANILFELLEKRKYTISHKNNTTYEEHLKFFKNNPYRNWFFVYLDMNIIGAAYFTFDNFIGINLIIEDLEIYKKTITKLITLIKPLPPKPSERSNKFCINVSPQNKLLQNALLELNAIEIQSTFKLN